jgi:hypothetical protein
MKPIRIHYSYSVVFLLLLGMGCGYRLGGEAFSPSPEVRSIAIPTFSNQTYEAGIETTVTNALLAELIKDRRIRVVGQDEADAVMEGMVTSFTTKSVAYDLTGTVVEYRAWVTLDVLLRRGKKGPVLWRKRGLRESEAYKVSEDVLETESEKDRVIQRISVELAKRIRRGLFVGL